MFCLVFLLRHLAYDSRKKEEEQENERRITKLYFK